MKFDGDNRNVKRFRNTTKKCSVNIHFGVIDPIEICLLADDLRLNVSIGFTLIKHNDFQGLIKSF